MSPSSLTLTTLIVPETKMPMFFATNSQQVSLILIVALLAGLSMQSRNDLPMRPIFMPERARALRADCAPGPGVLVLKLIYQHSNRMNHIRASKKRVGLEDTQGVRLLKPVLNWANVSSQT